MATACSFCGQKLPQGDNARFCSHCGKAVSDQLSSSPDAQSQVAVNGVPPVVYQKQAQADPGLHEQIAQQPAVRTAPSESSTATPWLGLSGDNVTPWHGVQGLDAHIVPASVEKSQAQDIEHLPTERLVSQKPSRSTPASDPPELPLEDLPTAIISTFAPATRVSVQETPDISLAGRHFETQAITAQPLRARRRRARPLLPGIIAIVIILAVALASWIILAQPFAVAANTDPLQTARSTPLGLVIAYPAGWTETQNSTSLTLSDSNNTDQMKITQSAISASDQTGYLKRQAATLGMSDAKVGSEISFAGSHWQQIHGDFIVMGAGYIGTIYATTHNNHLYTFIQMAPKVTFQDEERLVFAPARASLHFNELS